jgi:pseudouridine synthase
MRLNKFLAEQGYASRRGADTLIEEGAVIVNNCIAILGQCIDPEIDIIEVNKKTLQKKEEEKRYFILNKPTGYVCATKKTRLDKHIILDFFKDPNLPRIYPVGRLDKDSSGLILLTNDGDITYKLMHPSFEHEKEYSVEIYNQLTTEMIDRLKQPFYMLGQKTRKAKVIVLGKYNFLITLKEGKNRQIRRMVRSIGSGVKTLKRIRVEKLVLPKDLKEGEWKEILKKDIL